MDLYAFSYKLKAMSTSASVTLIGAGAMGGALWRGWLSSRSIDASRSAVIEPAPDAALKRLSREEGFALNPPIDVIDSDVLVFAVKPQAAASIAPAFAARAASALTISVMAGVRVETLSHQLGGAQRIVRAMPNLASSIGAGVAGLYAAPTVDPAARECADRLMSASGETVWVDEERAIDWVTAVSGSGPAYFFLLTEALAEAGVSLGLSRASAERLARATASGAGALLAADPRAPSEMRKAVASPGGTTAAALTILDGDAHVLRALMTDAVAAAARRAEALSA